MNLPKHQKCICSSYTNFIAVTDFWFSMHDIFHGTNIHKWARILRIHSNYSDQTLKFKQTDSELSCIRFTHKQFCFYIISMTLLFWLNSAYVEVTLHVFTIKNSERNPHFIHFRSNLFLNRRCN